MLLVVGSTHGLCGHGASATISPRNAYDGRSLQARLRSATTMSATPPEILTPPFKLLEDTNLGGRQLERCYKASVDGWTALDFHRQVDGVGSTLIIAETSSGARLGGYSPTGWESRDDYRATPRAFLFCSEPKDESDQSDDDEREWQVCAVLGPGDIAVFDYARGGPQFGAADLVIGPPKTPVMGGLAGPENDSPDFMRRTAGDLRTFSSQLGGSYAKLPRGSAFPKGELIELEAFCNAEFASGSGLRIKGAKTAPSAAASDGEEDQPKVGWWPF